MTEFIHEDFLLQSDSASRLYHEYAKDMPIYDYHCHLNPEDIATNKKYENLTQIWLYGDHYKWRAMRTNGVSEQYCTGCASDWEKFQKWAYTIPYCLRNPLYHWTHLELANPFGIKDKLLSLDTAEEIYARANELLATDGFRAKALIEKANVKVIATTDDPTDSLEHHIAIANSDFSVKVCPTWRPDKAMATENVAALNAWIDKLASVSDVDIVDFQTYLDALRIRHNFFNENGTRISDHGLETLYATDYTQNEIEAIFAKLRSAKELDYQEQLKFKSAMMYEFAVMDAQAGWTQQLHFGVMRNNNTRMFESVGADTGFDSIGDFSIAASLAKFLDRLDKTNSLPKTIIYNINPSDNEIIATMIGNFQDGTVAGKIQFGSGWWFLDQKDGMEKQINALSTMGLLSRFVGMLTDSRSFLSYSRHEYFRRILSNMLGNDIEAGLLPKDFDLIGNMLKDICYNNAHDYFGLLKP